MHKVPQQRKSNTSQLCDLYSIMCSSIILLKNSHLKLSIQFNSILLKLTQIQYIREGYNYYSSVTKVNMKNTVQ